MSVSGWSASNYLRYSAALVSALPVTMAVWGYTSILSSNQGLIGLYNSGSAYNRNSLKLGIAADNTIVASAASATDSNGSGTTGTISANTWFHAAGVFNTPTDRTAYLNGVAGGAPTLSRTPSTWPNRTCLGSSDTTTTEPFAPGGTGYLAEAAMWSIALPAADIAALAAGLSPLKVHPEALIAYWPLMGSFPARNLLSNVSVLSQVGTLSAAGAHPKIIKPRRRKLLV